MSLPKHNPLLKGLYVLLVLVMFAFMALLINTYWPESEGSDSSYENYGSDYDYELTENKVNEGILEKEANTIKHQSDYVLDQDFRVVGIKRKVYLNTNVSGQLEDLWDEFNRSELWNSVSQVKNYNEIYMVYDQWNFKQNSVDVTIGYPSYMKITNSSGLKAIEVPKGEFLVRKSVLNMWQKSSEMTLTYTKDFEFYQLDEQYNIQQQVAYLRIR